MRGSLLMVTPTEASPAAGTTTGPVVLVAPYSSSRPSNRLRGGFIWGGKD